MGELSLTWKDDQIEIHLPEGTRKIQMKVETPQGEMTLEVTPWSVSKTHHLYGEGLMRDFNFESEYEDYTLNQVVDLMSDFPDLELNTVRGEDQINIDLQTGFSKIEEAPTDWGIDPLLSKAREENPLPEEAMLYSSKGIPIKRPDSPFPKSPFSPMYNPDSPIYIPTQLIEEDPSPLLLEANQNPLAFLDSLDLEALIGGPISPEPLVENAVFQSPIIQQETTFKSAHLPLKKRTTATATITAAADNPLPQKRPAAEAAANPPPQKRVIVVNSDPQEEQLPVSVIKIKQKDFKEAVISRPPPKITQTKEGFKPIVPREYYKPQAMEQHVSTMLILQNQAKHLPLARTFYHNHAVQRELKKVFLLVDEADCQVSSINQPIPTMYIRKPFFSIPTNYLPPGIGHSHTQYLMEISWNGLVAQEYCTACWLLGQLHVLPPQLFGSKYSFQLNGHIPECLAIFLASHKKNPFPVEHRYLGRTRVTPPHVVHHTEIVEGHNKYLYRNLFSKCVTPASQLRFPTLPKATLWDEVMRHLDTPEFKKGSYCRSCFREGFLHILFPFGSKSHCIEGTDFEKNQFYRKIDQGIKIQFPKHHVNVPTALFHPPTPENLTQVEAELIRTLNPHKILSQVYCRLCWDSGQLHELSPNLAAGYLSYRPTQTSLPIIGGSFNPTYDLLANRRLANIARTPMHDLVTRITSYQKKGKANTLPVKEQGPIYLPVTLYTSNSKEGATVVTAAHLPIRIHTSIQTRYNTMSSPIQKYVKRAPHPTITAILSKLDTGTPQYLN